MANRSPHVPPRRRFFKRLVGLALGAPFVAALVAMLRREQAREVPSVVSISTDVPTGLSVVESAIVYREPGGAIHAFSGRCTHLGVCLTCHDGDSPVLRGSVTTFADRLSTRRPVCLRPIWE